MSNKATTDKMVRVLEVAAEAIALVIMLLPLFLGRRQTK